jgi:protein required for attachment to host cells
MKKSWILVAESSRARIFNVDSASGPLVEIETLAHPEGREHEQDMTSDLPGRDSDKAGAGRHAFGDEIEPKEQETIDFAKRIASRLESARTDGTLKQLIIVAAPAFLGTLRNQLNEELKKRVTFELDKNLSQHSPEDIRQHLPEYLPSL